MNVVDRCNETTGVRSPPASRTTDTNSLVGRLIADLWVRMQSHQIEMEWAASSSASKPPINAALGTSRQQ